jgi:glycopeptide antibiotics resistance protein
MSVILGASLEITQLFISIILGYPYRMVDVNDFLFNTIGVLVGYGLFKLIARLYLMIGEQTGDTKKGLLLYLDNVVHQREDIY